MRESFPAFAPDSCHQAQSPCFWQAKVEGVTNEPNQVYLFSYSNRDGRSGLKFAWSPDGEKWFSVADGFAYVNSDFGPWGRAKTMFKPHLMQTRADGKWHCIWEATNTGQALAYVTSPDLQKWEAQSYFSPEERSKYEPKDVYPTTQKKVLVNGSEEDVCVKLRKTTFRAYMTIKEELEHLFHTKVDLITLILSVQLFVRIDEKCIRSLKL